MNYFAKNIKYLRKKRRLKQSEVSLSLGFSANRWSNYEKSVSTPSFDDLLKIIEYFDIPPTELILLDLEKAHLIEDLRSGNLSAKSASKSAPKCAPNDDFAGNLVVPDQALQYGNNAAQTELSRLHTTISALEAAVQALSASNARYIKDIEDLQLQNERLKKEVPSVPGRNHGDQTKMA